MSGMDYSAVANCHCGKPLQQPTGKGRKKKYCSSQCKGAARGKPYARKGAREFRCAHCTSSFVAERKRKYCSEDCYADALAVMVRSKRQARNKSDPPIKCRKCAAVFCVLPSVPGTAAYCVPCAQSRKDTAYSLARRKRIKAVTVEAVDRIAVFERDNWRCQMCGVKTIRQPYKPRSAELDHIIPLSQGGEHSYRNVQCACRQCNGSKGAATKG